MVATDPVIRPRLISILFVLTAIAGLSGCAWYDNKITYFNTYYNMQRIRGEVLDEFDYQEELKRNRPRVLIPGMDSLKLTSGPPKNSTYQFLRALQIDRTKLQPVAQKVDSMLIKGSKVVGLHPKSEYVEGALFLMAEAYFFRSEWVPSQQKCIELIERYPDGSERVRFRTVSAKQTPVAMDQLVADWQACLEERWVPPLIALAAFNLDFLCIHPFRDGNGRVSRLLWLLQSYQLGLEVGRYISLERLVEQNKDRYYETLEQSSQGWHEGKHDPWPYINYVLSILKAAYREFVERVGETSEPRGSKTQLVLEVIGKISGTFSLADLERACPGVSRDMIRRVLNTRKGQTVDCIGRGPGALWQKR